MKRSTKRRWMSICQNRNKRGTNRHKQKRKWLSRAIETITFLNYNRLLCSERIAQKPIIIQGKDTSDYHQIEKGKENETESIITSYCCMHGFSGDGDHRIRKRV